MGTFLPLLLGLATVCGVPFVISLLFAGLWNIVTGFLFRIPMAVQPMKAIAAIAIAEELTTTDVAASGLLVGVAIVVLGVCGGFDWLFRIVPRAVVRGLQFGLAMSLALKAVAWIAPALHDTQTLLIAGVCALLAIANARLPAALLIFAGGLAVAGLDGAGSEAAVVWSSQPDWSLDSWLKAIPVALAQLPLTAVNSVVAVVVLAHDLFPEQRERVTPKRVSISVGMMNLVGGVFGAMPVCHGSGGLAAQYRFGARTMNSMLLLGGIKIAAALLIGGWLLPLLAAFPEYLLGIMLLVTSFELGRHGLNVSGRNAWITMSVTAGIIVIAGSLWGVLAGCLLWPILNRAGDNAA